MSATSVFRLHWKREGWAQVKASPRLFVSKRAALKELYKMEHSTSKFGLGVIVESFITEGTVHWSPHHVSLPDEAQVHTQPKVKAKNRTRGRSWPELFQAAHGRKHTNLVELNEWVETQT